MITKNICSFEEWVENIKDLEGYDEEKAREMYDRVVATVHRYVPEDHEGHDIRIWVGGFGRSAGYQRIAEGSVSDMNKPYNPDSFNFHFQNTSQWLFAYGVVFDTERHDFSMHT